MSSDDEFKRMVGEAIVSLNNSVFAIREDVGEIRQDLAGVKQDLAGVKVDLKDLRHEFSEFKIEVNEKLDGIGNYLLSSDQTHRENSERISLLENRVDKLEDERKKDSA